MPSSELGEDGALVFHAGTRLNSADGCGGEIVTDGGRVLSVTATGATRSEAAASAYRTVESVSFDGAVWREDIGRDVAWKRIVSASRRSEISPVTFLGSIFESICSNPDHLLANASKDRYRRAQWL